MTFIIESDHIETVESALEIVTEQNESTVIQNIVEDATPVLEEMQSLDEGEDGSVPTREMDNARTVLELAARYVDDSEQATAFRETADWLGGTIHGSWPKLETTDFTFRTDT